MKTYKSFEESLTPEQRAEAKAAYDAARAAVPEVLRNLVWEGGEMYYVDDNGKRIDKKLDMPYITQALKDAMPKTPIVVNGEEKDRAELLDAELEKIK